MVGTVGRFMKVITSLEICTFSYELETYGTQLRSRYGIEDIYSTNHSAQNHCSTNQNAWIPHDEGAIRSPHGMNRTVTTSHSYENGSMYDTVLYWSLRC